MAKLCNLCSLLGLMTDCSADILLGATQIRRRVQQQTARLSMVGGTRESGTQRKVIASVR
jgi:hypothetical protein